MRKIFEQLITAKQTGLAAEICLLPLTAISLLFRLIVQARTMLYKSGRLKTWRLPCGVIVVGNITTGGTGKTPLVMFLAEALTRGGLNVAVLTRGYGRKKSQEVMVLSEDSPLDPSPETAGDEAMMMASKLKTVPVVCSADRVKGGHLAVARFNPDILLLDDGFQHLRLHRDLDIVLINATDPFGNGSMLPRGRLREPLSSLRRAGAIVVTKSGFSTAQSVLIQKTVKQYCPGIPLFYADLAPSAIRDPTTGDTMPAGVLNAKKILALCSIGDPETFFSVLQHLNPASIEKLPFPDHHLYKPRDYSTVRSRAQSSDIVVTTEKDIAKIDLNMIDKKVVVLETAVAVDNPDKLISLVRQCLINR